MHAVPYPLPSDFLLILFRLDPQSPGPSPLWVQALRQAMPCTHLSPRSSALLLTLEFLYVRGLVIAGLATEYTALGWRTYFYIITAISAALTVSAIWIVPGRNLPRRQDPQATVDYVGALLGIAGLVCFTFALADGEGAEHAWSTTYIIVLLVVGAALIAAFIGWEWYVENKTTQPPLFRLSLWHKGRFTAFQVIGFLLFAGFQP